MALVVMMMAETKLYPNEAVKILDEIKDIVENAVPSGGGDTAIVTFKNGVAGTTVTMPLISFIGDDATKTFIMVQVVASKGLVNSHQVPLGGSTNGCELYINAGTRRFDPTPTENFEYVNDRTGIVRGDCIVNFIAV